MVALFLCPLGFCLLAVFTFHFSPFTLHLKILSNELRPIHILQLLHSLAIDSAIFSLGTASGLVAPISSATLCAWSL